MLPVLCKTIVFFHATTEVFHCEAENVGIRTKNSWYYPACGGGKCKKGVTHQEGKLWCNSCNKPVNYPKPMYTDLGLS